MRIRLVWPDCRYQNRHWDAIPIDSFWVECYEDEAMAEIVPRLSQSAKVRFDILMENLYNIDTEPRICFLVSRDLRSIEAIEWTYPFGSLWNAYSPFRQLPAELSIVSLNELAGISIPDELRKTGDD